MSGHGNQDADYLNGRYKEIVCPECGGEGICYRTQALDDCTACKGTGRVPAVGVPEVPALNGPEFTDWGRAALLWVLWHHQGGSSPVGGPIRFALGMGQHDHLSDSQVAEAKRWAELTRTAGVPVVSQPQRARRCKKVGECPDWDHCREAGECCPPETAPGVSVGDHQTSGAQATGGKPDGDQHGR